MSKNVPAIKEPAMSESSAAMKAARDVARSLYRTDDEFKMAIDVIKKKYNIDQLSSAVIMLLIERVRDMIQYHGSKVTEINEAIEQFREWR